MSQKPKALPSYKVLVNAIKYDPDSGLLTWKFREDRNQAWNARFGGKEAGYEYTNTSQSHYKGRVIGVSEGGKSSLYQAHRIAWKLATGDEPPEQIDHKNGNALDNRWCNLRDGSQGVNETNRKKYKNNISGITGVSKKGNRWRARVRKGGKLYNLGTFSKIEDAEIAAVEFRKRNGFSESHGVRVPGSEIRDNNGQPGVQQSKGVR